MILGAPHHDHAAGPGNFHAVAALAAWRKATYSNGEGSCIEAGSVPGLVLVRDTTQHGRGPVLRVTPADWDRFTASIKGLASDPTNA